MKGTSTDVTSLASSTLGTSVTAVFHQPIMSPTVPLNDELHKEEDEVEVEVEKKDSDEEPMEMVLDKLDEVEDVKNANQILTKMVKTTVAEDLKPMDTDKDSLSKTPEIVHEDSADVAPMQTDEQLNKEVYLLKTNETPLYTAETVALDDLTLLAELFYLPYEHGSKAVQMLKEFNWLRANSSIVSVNLESKDADKVTDMHKFCIEGLCSWLLEKKCYVKWTTINIVCNYLLEVYEKFVVFLVTRPLFENILSVYSSGFC